MSDTLEHLYTYKEAMEHFRISRATMYRLQKAGKLVGDKIGGTWRFSKEQIDAALRPVSIEKPVQTEQGEAHE